MKNTLNKVRLAVLMLMVALLLAACSNNTTPTTGATNTTTSAATTSNTANQDSSAAMGSVGSAIETTTATTQTFEQASTSQTPTPAPNTTPASTPIAVINANLKTSLTIWSAMSGAQSQLLTDQVKQFMQAYPGVKVNVINYNPDEIATEFQSAVTSGKGPDLIFTTSDNVSSFVAANAVQPVNTLINTQQYAANAVAPSQYQGKQYGVPYIYGNTVVMLYNKNLVSAPPTDTDQWITIARELTQRNGKASNIGMVMDINEPANLTPWVYAFGGSLLNAQGQPDLDSSAMQQALGFFQQLVKDKVVTANYNPAQNQADYAFRDGRLGFYITTDTNALNYLNSSAASSSFKNSNKAVEGVGLDLGIAPLPKVTATGKNSSPFTDSEAMFVNAKTSGNNLEAAKDFFSFVATGQEQSYMATRYHLLPPTGAGLSSDAVKNDAFLSGLAQQLALATPMPSQPQMMAIWDAIRPNLEQVAADTAKPDAAAQAMQQAVVAEIQTLGLAKP